jgi:hypothetical protein
MRGSGRESVPLHRASRHAWIDIMLLAVKSSLCKLAKSTVTYFVLLSDEALCISGVLATVQLYFIAEERLEIPMRRLSKLHCLQRLSKYSMCAHSDTHSKLKYVTPLGTQGWMLQCMNSRELGY